jgi:CRISPR-associated protein Cas1
MKKNIYITSNQEITRTNNILKIGEKKLPLSVINNLFIIGYAKVSQGAKNLLLKNNRTIFYLNNKYELIGILHPPVFNSDYRVRLLQYENRNNLELAKFIVLKKIEAIEYYTNKSLKRYKEKLDTITNLNEILGVEGNSTIYMYKKFKEELQDIGIDEFKKREYRPVKDRVNGLLSFLYTLYYSFLHSVVVSEGFDPYIGFLHIKRGRHLAFVSDMMEEARIYLTKLAVEILEEVYPDGFDGLYLDYETRKIVLKKFDNFIETYENTLLKEIKEKLC